MKIRRGIAIGWAMAVLLLLSQSGVALANGVGDLYVATRAGVLEVHVLTSQVVNTVPIVPPPTALAFSPDGKSLFVASDGTRVTRIDIETLDTDEPIPMPGVVTGLAFPSGQVLVGTIPSDDRLVFIRPSTAEVTESEKLPGTPNLIAGDRHDSRVVAAEAGKSWLAVVDPSTAELHTTQVTGGIRALAIDRDSGAALVATANPNAVVRIDLSSLTPSWTAPLSEAPVAVASLGGVRVVASQTELWSAGSDGVKSWAKPKGTIVALAASDEGKALHVAESNAVEVFDTSGSLKRTVALTGDRAPVALAAVPAGSSLFVGRNESAAPKTTAPAPGGGSTASGEAPVTSTIVDGVQQIINERQVQGAAIVAVSILIASWLLIHAAERRRTRR